VAAWAPTIIAQRLHGPRLARCIARTPPRYVSAPDGSGLHRAAAPTPGSSGPRRAAAPTPAIAAQVPLIPISPPQIAHHPPPGSRSIEGDSRRAATGARAQQHRVPADARRREGFLATRCGAGRRRTVQHWHMQISLFTGLTQGRKITLCVLPPSLLPLCSFVMDQESLLCRMLRFPHLGKGNTAGTQHLNVADATAGALPLHPGRGSAPAPRQGGSPPAPPALRYATCPQPLVTLPLKQHCHEGLWTACTAHHL